MRYECSRGASRRDAQAFGKDIQSRAMARSRARHVLVAAALAIVVLVALVVAWSPAPVPLATVAGQPTLWRGVYHVHSTRSDGSGTPEDIARAAAARGLEFVILTDHGDGTRPPDAPRYVDGVLLIDALEISTDDGHYVALGLPVAPYRLAGEGRAVADDVRRLGGLGILAHPDSPRPSLAWHDWSVKADGYEWVNADSAWRGAGTARLIGLVLSYPWRPSAALTSLAQYPDALVARLDTPTRVPQVALAAVDAHARIGGRREDGPFEAGRPLARVPSYEASFGTFGLMVPWITGGPTGEAARDAGSVLQAIRDRLAYAAVFSMASPVWLSYGIAGAPPGTGVPGLDAHGPATLHVRTNVPAGSVIRIRRNGMPWRERHGAALDVALAPDAAPAVYRAEVWLPRRRGWPDLPVAVGGARLHNVRAGGSAGTAEDAREGEPRVPLEPTGWHVEHDAASSARMERAPPGAAARATLALAPGARVSQFAALVADLPPAPPVWARVRLQVSASAPMRLSIQAREPRAGDGLRWRHSLVAETTPSWVTLDASEFRPVPPAAGPLPTGRQHALLLVMDTVNSRPGDARTVTVHSVEWLAHR